jgi:hypothetical protein
MDDISEYWPWPILPIIIFSGIIVFTVVGYLLERKRSQALEVIASSMGLSFRGKEKLPQDVKAANFHLFSQGSSSIQNLMYAHGGGFGISLFGYSYAKGRSRYNQTVALFYSESISLPNFDLRPEHVFHRIGRVFGYQDIDFETHPQFSSHYLLRGEDEDAIRKIFTYDILAFFSNNTGLSVEARGNRLLFYRHRKRAKPDDMPSFLHEARSIFDLFRGSQGRQF